MDFSFFFFLMSTRYRQAFFRKRNTYGNKHMKRRFNISSDQENAN